MTEKKMESPSEKVMADNEDIIELTDEVIELTDEVIELTETVSEKDDVIELTEKVAAESNVAESDSTTVSDKAEAEFADVSADEDEVVKLAGAFSGFSSAGEAVPGNDTDALPMDAVTPGQIDAAVERAVNKIYGEKIERLLVEIVQKKVSDEITKVKKMILDDSSGS